MKNLFIIAMALISFVYSDSDDSEEIEVCAKYRTEWEWSKGYQVQARSIHSSELNGTGNGRFPMGYYVVIFWEQDQASIIKLEGVGPLGGMRREGEDRQGKRWEVKESSYCY
jgi:hypothetical protein